MENNAGDTSTNRSIMTPRKNYIKTCKDFEHPFHFIPFVPRPKLMPRVVGVTPAGPLMYYKDIVADLDQRLEMFKKQKWAYTESHWKKRMGDRYQSQKQASLPLKKRKREDIDDSDMPTAKRIRSCEELTQTGKICTFDKTA